MNAVEACMAYLLIIAILLFLILERLNQLRRCRISMGAIMSKPIHARFELYAIDERVKLVLLVSFGAALVTVFGFGLLVVWAG